MLVILFGLPASGKNYIGEIFKKDFGFFFYDADDDLTPQMKELFAQEKIIPDEILTEYVNHFIQRIKKLRKTNKKLVVSQCLSKDRNRKLILQHFPDAKFILVKARANIRSARSTSRAHIVNENLAKKVTKIFERPKIQHYTINNNKRRDQIKIQIKKFLKSI